jgi:aryl-alcohol dehydrogenase-like predicted oxidoreductase
MKRREFIRSVAVTGAATAAGAVLRSGEAETAADGASTNAARLPRRNYGKTDVRLSIIGFGGIVVMGGDQERANRVVAETVERGVNYFDVAPSYGGGEAEEKLGPALEPYRKDSFLACKTGIREPSGAEAEFRRSLERLRTDYFDLYQLHGITNVANDVDAVMRKGGVMDFLVERRNAGQICYLGFSAHSVEAAFAAMDRFDFDSALFPVNFANQMKGNFGRQIVERAQAKGVARLALKGLARQRWPDKDPQRAKFGKCWYQPLTDAREAELGLRWTLSQPITAAIPPSEESLFRIALDIAATFQPITAEEERELVALAETLNPIFSAA